MSSLPKPTALDSRSFTSKSGAKIDFSFLGLGTAALGNLYKAQSESGAAKAYKAAFDLGINYVDTAPFYGFGLAERRTGSALRNLAREEVILSTKAGRLLRCVAPSQSDAGDKWIDVPSRAVKYDYSYDGFMRSYEFSLERLGVDYIDILYCHDVDITTHGSKEVSDTRVKEFLAPSGGYKALRELRASGAVKAIGLGVNEWQVSETIARETDVDLFLLAGRFTLLEQEALNSFLPLCEKQGQGVVIGGPFNSGILATGPVQGAWYNYDIASEPILARVREIEAICKSHSVALKDAALQFPLHHPAVVSVIPGGASAEEVSQNVASMATTIPDGLWRDLQNQGLLHPELTLT